jgi:uncharacterized protein
VEKFDMNVVRNRVRGYTPSLLLTLMACVASGLALAAAPWQLPPIGSSKTPEHHPGKIIWADLVTPDLAASESFYAGLLGWTFQTVHAGSTDYAVAMIEGRPVAGLLQKPMPPGEHRQPAWLTFIAVRDVDAAEKIALKAGASSVAEAKTYPGRGRQAVLADPDGAVFAILASSSGDSPDFLAAPGEWLWSSLLAPDPARSATFYKAVFGYNVFELPSDDDAIHVILSSDNYARASINALPPGHRHPHWLNFVRVVNAAEVSAKAVSLGGRVLVEPYVDRHGGKIAVIADPAGAPIGLMEWSETDSKVEPK